MNIRSHLRQQQISNIRFHEKAPSLAVSIKRYQNYSSTSSPNLSRSVVRPRTSDYKQYETTNQHPMSGLSRRQANTYRDQQKVRDDDSYYQGLYQQEIFGEQNRQFRKQQQRHIEFAKSYHQWLKETQVEEYQSSRMINSFALKKTRASLKPKKQEQQFQFKVYQPLFNNTYHPPNLFPSRTHQSLKKMQQPKSSRNHQRLKHKNEGELKIQLMKSIAKREASTKQQKSRKKCKAVCNDQTNKNHQLFIKTFSNPKLLSIKNGQLVTGTKILFNN